MASGSQKFAGINSNRSSNKTTAASRRSTPDRKGIRDTTPRGQVPIF